MRKMMVFVLGVAMLLGLAACSGSGPASSGASPAEESSGAEADMSEADVPAGETALSGERFTTDFTCADNYRVFYEIFVGSFSDSNGDGIGDLRGIINRMDYLNDGDPASGKSLGVEGLWLTPIFESPSYHKYDVADYYAIDPQLGTMDDLKELLAVCHERNVLVILDLPINHTARRNSWYSSFLMARRSGDTESPYYDFYSTSPKGEAAPAGRVFQEASGTDVLVECNFSDGMPELNYDCEGVREAVLDVAKFYLDLGVDGFRFDAAKYIYLGDNERSAAFWEWYMGELRAVKPDVYAVAEVWDADGVTDFYYPAMDCFNFTMSQSGGTIADTANHRDATRLTSYVGQYCASVAAMREGAMIVPFVSNHDMDRAAGFLTVSSGNMKMAANLYLLGPGSPFIYYGEEIGMKGSRGGANTDANRRLAMLWGDGDTVRDPEGTTYGADKQADTSVAAQLPDPDSLYNYYKELLMLRHANPEIARGQYRSLPLSGTKLGGFVSTWQDKEVCVIHNTTEDALTLELDGAGLAGMEITAAVGAGSAAIEGGTLTLDGRTSVILR